MIHLSYLFLFGALVFNIDPRCGEGASRQEEDLIAWNEYFHLDWADFRGKRPETAIGDAGTYVTIKAKPFFKGKAVHYNVTAYFIKSKSWAIDQSPELLQHEQLHFDIAEIYARKIRQKVAELQRSGERDVAIYNAAIRRILEDSNRYDAKYDLETLHGSLDKTQQQWEVKVADELSALKRWRKQKQIVK